MERYFSTQRVLCSSFFFFFLFTFRTFAFISILDTTPWTTFRSFLSFLNLETANYRHFPFVLQNLTKRKAEKGKKDGNERVVTKIIEKKSLVTAVDLTEKNNVRWPFFLPENLIKICDGYVYLILKRKAILIVSYSNVTCCTLYTSMWKTSNLKDTSNKSCSDKKLWTIW